ncbi:CatB-related O-acetyltransferase [Pontibacter ramchanderi]|uniref:Acetyltransferase-like isoleucine patch superfamily enzyme n=1 Tax=Pontibacter ramchanderi TaxID=1179743 RepID=A0A2N3U8Z2_9BACT|nr:CatB-related O-acetyltransferase [Pontibacter ramchanderi]PKV63223.1 acetyltransferase-like isoleucine patch superfamily enzyme [Pontibacter ramchanderi]
MLTSLKSKLKRIVSNYMGSLNSRLLSEDIHIKKASIKGNVNLEFGVKIVGGVKISGNVSIGKLSVINGPNTDIYSKINSVQIGRFCSIARNVSIQEYHHKMDRISTYFMSKNIFNNSIESDIVSKGDIIIGNDVWIGTHCVILSGAHISNGVIVAANSVVSGYIPPYAIVAGSPAKVIKYRFDTAIIQKINDLAWWDWDVEKIQQNEELFLSTLTEDILNKYLLRY